MGKGQTIAIWIMAIAILYLLYSLGSYAFTLDDCIDLLDDYDYELSNCLDNWNYSYNLLEECAYNLDQIEGG